MTKTPEELTKEWKMGKFKVIVVLGVTLKLIISI